MGERIVGKEDEPRTILMADDDEEDCFLAREAIAESGVGAAFSCVGDGIELMDYLSEHSRSGMERLPDLILLDLNMPRKDGREAISEIKAEPVFKGIPIIILTTSKEKGDIAFCMKEGAESFITKPATFGGWVQTMKSLAERWLR
jgi:CheY-like chemotaxis protein